MEEQEEPREYILFPEGAIKYLPKNGKKYLYALKEEEQGVPEIEDDNLGILNHLVHAFPTMASLRYIQHRLTSTKLVEWALENDMLTSAFGTTYARLIDGGIGSGVSRRALSPELRRCMTTY
ncbi:hypothetical protein ATN84_16330 [Paramesorhizobium deserti]|uniref:Uncharacterized protein n=1 Tax=Paramesorhizobium deserti TaxID=1494590 RepID=A0A135HQW2_9HYPH|nr:hypothetical protein [Paramesorhizobium deserti]KXF75570.1 hypothetical protein ATN84_16330 [Paramesorhizobium deserti]